MFGGTVGGIVCLAAWIWALIVVLSGPVGWLEILFFVLFAVYLLVFLVPGIIRAVKKG